ncbi:hypothetical protein RCL1_000898 [Eukaryota sp. TZLM3-RCL]
MPVKNICWGLICGTLFISAPSRSVITNVISPLAHASSLESKFKVSERDVLASIQGWRYVFNPIPAVFGVLLGPSALLPCVAGYRFRFSKSFSDFHLRNTKFFQRSL